MHLLPLGNTSPISTGKAKKHFWSTKATSQYSEAMRLNFKIQTRSEIEK